MTFCSKMNDTIHLLILHQTIEGVEVAYVHLHKLIIGAVFNVLEIGKVARICQFVKIDDAILWIFVHEKSYDVGTDESGSACNHYCLHSTKLKNFLQR